MLVCATISLGLMKVLTDAPADDAVTTSFFASTVETIATSPIAAAMTVFWIPGKTLDSILNLGCRVPRRTLNPDEMQIDVGGPGARAMLFRQMNAETGDDETSLRSGLMSEVDPS